MSKNIKDLLLKYEYGGDISYLEEAIDAHPRNFYLLTSKELLYFLYEGIDAKKEVLQAIKEKNLNVNDDLLVFAYQNGIEEAGDVIKEKYIPIVEDEVSKLIYRGYYAVGYEKDDLFQEAYIGFLNSFKNYKVHMRNPFRIFVRFVVKRSVELIISRTRNDKQKALNRSNSYDAKVSEDSDTTFKDFIVIENEYEPEERMRNRERIEEVWEFLSLFEKSVLLYYSEGLSYEDIGNLLLRDNDDEKRRIKSVDNAVQRINKKRDIILENNKSGGF